MAWHSLAPDGSKSVKANNTILNENTSYTETTMGNVNNDTTNTNSVPDHYWNQGAPFDSRHRFINMPGFTISGVATDPVIGSLMGGTAYFKQKSITDSPDNQDIQAFFKNRGLNAAGPPDQVMQLLGIRACMLFDVGPIVSPVTNIILTPKYSHNCSIDGGRFSGIGFNNVSFKINFTVALPTKKYLVFGGSVGRSGGTFPNVVAVQVDTDSNTNNVKTTNFVTMVINDTATPTRIPVQVWMVCFGG